MIHEDGTVLVGISGEARGNAVSIRYADMLQNALNESAGYNKYTVSAITDENLLVKIPEAVGNGNEPEVRAELKAVTAAHYNDSSVMGMDTRSYTPIEAPHSISGTNQMEPCDTCREYMGVYIRYANGESFTD